MIPVCGAVSNLSAHWLALAIQALPADRGKCVFQANPAQGQALEYECAEDRRSTSHSPFARLGGRRLNRAVHLPQRYLGRLVRPVPPLAPLCAPLRALRCAILGASLCGLLSACQTPVPAPPSALYPVQRRSVCRAQPTH
jgi:hypothetical protein